MKDDSGYFRVLEDDGQFNLAFYCPGCECSHGLNTNQNRRPAWIVTFFDGKPTVSPSILVRHKETCHLFIKDGKIEFLSDCTHKLAGKTVDMELDAVS